MVNQMRTRLITLLLAALFAGSFLATAVAAAQDSVTMSATVGGTDVSTGEPVRLEPGETVEVAVELTNAGNAAVDIRRVELSGSVLGLTFFQYSTGVQFTVEPGSTDTLRYQLDLYGLDGQATGLMGGELKVTDGDGDTIASIPMVSDIRGSLVSVYGLFGIVLTVLTVLALLDVILAVARHRLSENRWQRGLRLLAPGVGIGLVVAFSASVARLWVPETGLWLVLAGLTAAVFFALGYFSPTPDHDDELDDDLEDLEDDLDEEYLEDPHDADTIRARGEGAAG